MFKWVKKTGGGIKNTIANEGKTLLNTDEAKRYGSKIIDDAKKSLNPFAVKKGRQESFEAAMLRMNLTENDIRNVYTNHQLRFYIGTGIMIVAIVVGAKMLIQSNWFALGPAIACIAICLSQIFDGSFRTYQIRKRELVSVGEWFADKSGWIPTRLLSPEEIEDEKRKAKKRKSTALTKK